MIKFKKYLLSITLVILSLSLTAFQAFGEDFSKPDELVLNSEAVFKSFMADTNMEWFQNNVSKAKGIFILPRMLRGGFIFGGAGGSGALLAQNRETGKWSYPAFYTMGSVSFGLQIGADATEIILLVMTDRGMEAMLSKEFKLGGDVTLAAGPLGRSAKAQTADILAYGRSKGAFAGLAIDGAVIAPRYEWNNTYYGKEVLLVDILINQTVSNPKAENLRVALPSLK